MTQPASIERYNKRRLTVCYSNVKAHAMLRQTGLPHYTLDKSSGVKIFALSHNYSIASNANVYTFAENGQFQCKMKLSVLLVEAIAPNPENAEITSATYAPYWSFFNLTSLCVLKVLFKMKSSKYERVIDL